MKQIFCALLIALAFAACNKEKQDPQFEKTFPGPMDTGYLEAYRGEEFWQSTAEAQYSIFDSAHVVFICFTYSAEGFNRELLSMSEIPLKIGKYPIKGNNAISAGLDGYVGAQYGWAEGDGDVLGVNYDHDDTVPSFLEVTMVDTVAKKIAGKFDRMVFKMRVSPSTQFAPNFYPQTVVVKNGKFDMKITK